LWLRRAGQSVFVTTSTTSLELALPAVPASAREARAAITDVLYELTDSERFADEVRLCVSEAVTNVVRHAYDHGQEGQIELVADHRKRELSVTVLDRGRGFPASRGRSEDGGYGLEIIGKLTSRYVVRRRASGGTELEMVFAVPPLAPTKRHWARTSPPARHPLRQPESA
jgi:anti-sigma regulatory factor (Ser/Thr protein kinase)